MNKKILMIFFVSFLSIFSFLSASQTQKDFYKRVVVDGNADATQLVKDTINKISVIGNRHLEQTDIIIFKSSHQKLTDLLKEIAENEDVWTNLSWTNLENSCHRIHRRCCVLKHMLCHFAVLTAIKTGQPIVIGSRQIIFFSKDSLDDNKNISVAFDLYFTDIMQQLSEIRRDPTYVENNEEALALLDHQLICIERQFFEKIEDEQDEKHELGF